MKKNLSHHILLMLALFISISVSGKNWFGNKIVKGNGNVIEQQRKIAEFDAITVAEGLNVFLKQGKKNAVKVVADENLHEYILTEVRDGTLKIHVEDNVQIRSAKSKDIYVTLVNINSLKASSGADVISEPLVLKNLNASTSSGADMNIEVKAERLSCKASSGSNLFCKGKSKEMTINSSSGADIKVYIITENLTCKASSGSDIEISGETGNLNVNTSSSGDVNAFGLQAEICNADASSGSDIRVSVSKELIAHASSGGDIEYRGNPRVDIHTSSGGDVDKD
jgi:hypothetical protein